MGIVILGAVLLVVAFLLGVSAAAFFALHFWRLQRTHEALLDKFVNLKAGRLPVVPTPETERRVPGMLMDDQREAEIERQRVEALMYRP